MQTGTVSVDEALDYLIQQQLGHANLSVTSRYLDRIAPQERVEAVKAREWRV